MGARGGYDQERHSGGSWAIITETNVWSSRADAILFGYRRASELCPGGFNVADTARASLWAGYDVLGALALFGTWIKAHTAILLVQCKGEPAVMPAPAPPSPPAPAPAPKLEGVCFKKVSRMNGKIVDECFPTMEECRDHLANLSSLCNAASDLEPRARPRPAQARPGQIPYGPHEPRCCFLRGCVDPGQAVPPQGATVPSLTPSSGKRSTKS